MGEVIVRESIHGPCASRLCAQWLAALAIIALTMLPCRVRALQGEAPADAAPATPFTPTVVSPTYFEKATDPHSLKQEDGWQVGGINTHFEKQDGGEALNLRGGLFFSRRLAARGILDTDTSFSVNRFGANTLGGTQTAFLPALLFGNAGGDTGTADRIIDQEMHYQAHGLNLTGSYTDVDKDFQGLDVLKRQMALTDPTSAGRLVLGRSQQSYHVDYTGVRGLTLSSESTTMRYDNAADKARDGLTNTRQTNAIAFALAPRQQLQFTQTTTTDDWDQAKAKKAGTETRSEALRLTSGVAQKSTLSLGQTLTETTTGTRQTDVRQRDMTLQWNEWRGFALQGTYTNRLIAQSKEQTDTLGLTVTTALLPNMQLTGKLMQSTTSKPAGAVGAHTDQLDMTLVTNVCSGLQVTSQFQDIDASNKNVTRLQDQQIAWTLSPRWKLTSRLLNSENAKTGANDRTEFLLSGQVGSKARPAQIRLLTRDEELPGAAQQQRRELSYTHALDDTKAPTTLQAQVGDYALAPHVGTLQQDMLCTLQLLAAHPTPRTTLSLGVYDGPVLGSRYLAYRAWGQRPQGNLEVWSAKEFVHYREQGGELVQALTETTKLVVKEQRGRREDTGRLETREYGVEQRLGMLTLLGGRRYTTTTSTATTLEESWWRLALTEKQPLPEWAVKSTRDAVFEDTAQWGLTVLPVWVPTPAHGLTIDRRLSQVAGRPTDEYAVQYADMLGHSCFVQGLFEQDPRKAGNPSEIDRVERSMVHIGYAVRPAVQVFARYLSEDRQDTVNTQCVRTIGVVGRLSSRVRLQLQLDAMRRQTVTGKAAGNAYLLAYERTLSADDSVVLKCRVNPSALYKPEDRTRLEASFRRVF